MEEVGLSYSDVMQAWDGSISPGALLIMKMDLEIWMVNFGLD